MRGLEVLRLYRAGKPGLSCLVMSLLDYGYRTPEEQIASRGFARELARAQREVARRSGCGSFDTYEATGGGGTAARWARAGLMSPDLGHPTGAGHEVVAGLLANAILDGYARYRRRTSLCSTPNGRSGP